MKDSGSSSRTVAEEYLSALAARGIRYVFANAGTDFAPIIEGLVASAETGREAPKFITVPHENVAVAMAHGYYRVSGEPAAVMVHVNVGTANALCGVMNATRDNIPILLAAGRTPLTDRGHPGSRSASIHWGQENFDQGGIVREHVKWDYELRTGQPVDTVVGRALDIAMSEPCGPVYLTLPREVLGGAAMGAATRAPDRALGSGPAVPSAAAIEQAAELIAGAEAPLIITSTAGRSAEGYAALSDLARAFALPILQANARDLNVASDHPMNLGSRAGTLVESADVILVIDSEVPWVPQHGGPRPGAKVIQLSSDPLYARYPFRDFEINLALCGNSAAALSLLHDALAARLNDDDQGVAERRVRIEAARVERADERAKVLEQASGARPIHPALIAACLNEVKSEDTIIVNELGVPPDYLDLSAPLSYLAPSTAGGLGFGLGAALGAKLAAPDSDVITIVGDGSYMFGNPTPAHFVGRAENLPTLTIVSNNATWHAVKSSTLGMYPDGRASKANSLPLVDLTPSPDYETTIQACGGHGERVDDPAALVPALERGLAAVRRGQSALLNVITMPGGRR